MGGNDEELEELRKRRLAQLQQNAAGQEAQAAEQAAARAEADAQRKQILRQILEPEARERLTRISMARPDVGAAIENQLIALAQSGRIQRKIDDETLRVLIERLLPKKRETRIERRGK
ncbi:MAG: DNA-binding protein [Euryarchaeota archaeon]|nr:DNA-binding protein [Euryarchaeota archaeon]